MFFTASDSVPNNRGLLTGDDTIITFASDIDSSGNTAFSSWSSSDFPTSFTINFEGGSSLTENDISVGFNTGQSILIGKNRNTTQKRYYNNWKLSQIDVNTIDTVIIKQNYASVQNYLTNLDEMNPAGQDLLPGFDVLDFLKKPIAEGGLGCDDATKALRRKNVFLSSNDGEVTPIGRMYTVSHQNADGSLNTGSSGPPVVPAFPIFNLIDENGIDIDNDQIYDSSATNDHWKLIKIKRNAIDAIVINQNYASVKDYLTNLDEMNAAGQDLLPSFDVLNDFLWKPTAQGGLGATPAVRALRRKNVFLSSNGDGPSISSLYAATPLLADGSFNTNFPGLPMFLNGIPTQVYKKDNLQIVDSNGVMTISIVPGISTSSDKIKDGDAILSFTASTNFSNADITVGNMTDTTSSSYVTVGTATTQALLSDVQESWTNLHRVTWFASGQTFNRELEIMKLNLGSRPIGTMEIYYGDGKDNDPNDDTNKPFNQTYADRKWTIEFTLTDVIISSVQEEISPLKNYYVSNPDENNSPYYDISSTNGGSAENTGATLSLWKGVTYQFERTVGSGHPFSIRGNGAGVALPTGVVLLNEPLSSSGNKLLLYVEPTYSGGNLEYYCTAHPTSMKGTITFQDQTTTDPGNYQALVNSDRHLEGGQNIHLEVDGEEIKL